MATPKIPEPPHLVTDLKTLCLATIAAYWERFAEEARRKRQTHADYLADLVSFEVAKRRERRIQRRIQEARFPILKTLDGFDFSAQPGLDREVVLELFRCAFVAEVVVVRMGDKHRTVNGGSWSHDNGCTHSKLSSLLSSSGLG